MLLLCTGCAKKEATFPKANSFYIEATASYRTTTGPRTFDAVITENYTEFTSENLPYPVRFENDLLTCGETSVSVEPKPRSLFRLSEFFTKLLGEETTYSCIRDESCAIVTAEIDGEEITIKADAETLVPSVIFGNEYTVAIRTINLE